MSTREAYKQRIQSELDLVEEKFARFKAQGTSFKPDVRLRHAQHVEKLEKKFDETKTKLREMNEADEHVWEQIKDGVEDMWSTLQSTLKDTVATFKEEHTKQD